MCASALLSLKDGPQCEDDEYSQGEAPSSPSGPSTPSAQIHSEDHAPPGPLLIISNLIFISSDSGSMKNFRAFEDGFAAYAASKAALNMGIRHLAAELEYTKHPCPPTILAVHPGEVNTDMAKSVSLAWEVDGLISPQESVGKMIDLIYVHGRGGEKEGEKGVARYLTWEGNEYPW
jgi:NAD(P)-dependent dehydrogenase (short-subunit alcohol dehydrogenase family)